MSFWTKVAGQKTHKEIQVAPGPVVPGSGKKWVRDGREGGFGARASAALNIGWQAGSVISSIESLTDKWLPQVSIIVTVKLWGSPQSNMSNLYYLASAIAANANQDTLRGFRGHMFAATILPHAKFVQVNIAMTSGGMLGQSGLFGGGGAGSSGRELIRAPIQDNYYAEKTWPFFMSDKIVNGKSAEPLGTVPGILGSKNPVIATNLAASNPYPAMDDISRQSDLTQLLAAALLGSCDTVQCLHTENYTAAPSKAADRISNESVTLGNTPANKLTSLAENVPGAPAIQQKC